MTVDGGLRALYSVFQPIGSQNRAVVIAKHRDSEIVAPVEFENRRGALVIATPEELDRQPTDGQVRLGTIRCCCVFGLIPRVGVTRQLNTQGVQLVAALVESR